MLALALALAQSSTSSTGRIVSAAAEIASISSAMGRSVGITPSLAREMLFVQGGSARPEVLLNAVAAAVHASVVDKGATLLIMRTPSDSKAIRAGLVAERTRCIAAARKRIAAFRREHLPNGLREDDLAEEYRRETTRFDDELYGRKRSAPEEYALQQLLPCAQLLDDLVDRIGIEVLAAVPSGTPVVFESDPGPGVAALPDCSDLLADYQASMAPLEAVISGDAPGARPEWWQFGDVSNSRIGLVRLRVRAGSDFIAFDLELYDSSGRLQDKALFDATASRPLILGASDSGRVFGVANAVRIPVTAEVQPDGHLMDLGSATPFYLSPDRVEPLNLFTNAAVASLVAGDDAGCVVADVPDSFLFTAARCIKAGELNCTAFRELVQSYEDFEKVTPPGATVRRPTDPEYVEAHRADRKSVARYARDLTESQSPKTRTRGRLFHEGFPAVWSWAGPWSNAADSISRSTDDADQHISPGLYAVIGAISGGGWDELQAGSRLTAGDLGIVPELTQFLIGDPRVSPTAAAPKVDLYQQHPIDLYRGTDLARTAISLRSGKQRVVSAWPPKGKDTSDIPGFWASADSVMRMFPFRSFDPSTGGPAQTRQQFEQDCANEYNLRFGTEDSTDIVIALPKGYSVTMRLSSTFGDLGPAVTFADFPQALKDQIWQRGCENARKQFEQFQATLRNPTTTPPTVGSSSPPP